MKLTPTYLKTGIILLAVVLISMACAREDLIKRGDTLPVAFKKSMALYQNGEYSDAAEAFETVISIGRGTQYGEEAQYFLAESYFNDQRYLLAASEYERYSSLFPRSAKRQEADFKEAYCYYRMSPRYQLDQTYTRTAIEKFQLFNSRYPDSDRVQEAAHYIDEMRSRLAHKLYSAADMYLRTDQYEAAVIYFDLVINQYPESVWAERSLVDQINTYVVYADNSVRSRQQERYQKAVESYETYLQLFPEGENRSLAEEYVDNARVALAELRNDAQESADTTAATTN